LSNIQQWRFWLVCLWKLINLFPASQVQWQQFCVIARFCWKVINEKKLLMKLFLQKLRKNKVVAETYIADFRTIVKN